MERRSNNRRVDGKGVPVQQLDTVGQRIGDTDNAESFAIDINDDLEMDL